MIKYYTMASANDYLGLSPTALERMWNGGRIQHDAVEVYRNGRERPLFSELTLQHFRLDLAHVMEIRSGRWSA